ncbi:MAG: tail protein X [Candidatus Dojkabacteria bacterium]|nr:tail protein X [Candidatus Dojkabacteria bacterium]
MKYITKDNDRWDSIAYNFYGNPYLYEPIILENPLYKNYFILPSGITLNIPDLYIPDDIQEVNVPWQTD